MTLTTYFYYLGHCQRVYFIDNLYICFPLKTNKRKRKRKDISLTFVLKLKLRETNLKVFDCFGSKMIQGLFQSLFG